MRVLILGGTGFIGPRAAEALRAAGHDVLTASRSAAADVWVDALDSDALASALDGGFDTVVNLLGAGLARNTADADTMSAVNGIVPATILGLLAKQDAPPHLVHAASSTERRRPHHRHESDYSESKHHGAIALRVDAPESGVPLTMLTIHNTYGPHQPAARFVAATISRLREGRPVCLEHPDRVRDFVLVDDVAASIRHAVEHRPDRIEEADIGTGIGLTLEDAARTIARGLGRPEDLVERAPRTGDEDDPNPTTVATVRGGTYGLCTTEFHDGLAITLEET